VRQADPLEDKRPLFLKGFDEALEIRETGLEGVAPVRHIGG